MPEMLSESEQARSPQTIVPDPLLLSALAEFSAAAGHEINNPLAVILGRVQLLLQGETEPSRRQSLETIAGQAMRIRDMIGDVMLFADPPLPCPATVQVSAVLQELESSVYAEHRYQSGQSHPHFEWAAAENLLIDGDPAQFKTVLAEILWNAFHPTVAATQVRLSAETDPTDSRFCLLRVSDDGRGLSAEEAVNLFNPFYSGRQAGRGLGFGLCKAWRLCVLNQGTLRVSSRTRRDACSDTTEFQIRWPVAAGKAATA